MKKRVAVIALHHPEKPHLYLHGKRRDNNKWCMPGGHIDEGEHPMNGAIRELREETGLNLHPKFVKQIEHPDIKVYLFKHPYQGLPVTNKNDPDQEFETFAFLDPTKDNVEWHVPKARNILLN